MNSAKTVVRGIWALWVIGILVNLAFFGGLVWVILHFVLKYW